MKPTAITEDDFLAAQDQYLGWCSTCREFTRDGTEPDAEAYDCPVCQEMKVVGAEQALILGLITFGEP